MRVQKTLKDGRTIHRTDKSAKSVREGHIRLQLSDGQKGRKAKRYWVVMTIADYAKNLNSSFNARA